jgi:hypothetical protein
MRMIMVVMNEKYGPNIFSVSYMSIYKRTRMRLMEKVASVLFIIGRKEAAETNQLPIKDKDNWVLVIKGINIPKNEPIKRTTSFTPMDEVSNIPLII